MKKAHCNEKLNFISKLLPVSDQDLYDWTWFLIWIFAIAWCLDI